MKHKIIQVNKICLNAEKSCYTMYADNNQPGALLLYMYDAIWAYSTQNSTAPSPIIPNTLVVHHRTAPPNSGEMGSRRLFDTSIGSAAHGPVPRRLSTRILDIDY